MKSSGQWASKHQHFFAFLAFMPNVQKVMERLDLLVLQKVCLKALF